MYYHLVTVFPLLHTPHFLPPLSHASLTHHPFTCKKNYSTIHPFHPVVESRPPLFVPLCRSSPSRRGLSHFPYDTSHVGASSTLHVSGYLGGIARFPTFPRLCVVHSSRRGLPLSIRRLTRASSTLHVSGCLGEVVRFPAFPLVSACCWFLSGRDLFPIAYASFLDTTRVWLPSRIGAPRHYATSGDVTYSRTLGRSDIMLGC